VGGGLPAAYGGDGVVVGDDALEVAGEALVVGEVRVFGVPVCFVVEAVEEFEEADLVVRAAADVVGLGRG
jgi:hypothetical protein